MRSAASRSAESASPSRGVKDACEAGWALRAAGGLCVRRACVEEAICKCLYLFRFIFEAARSACGMAAEHESTMRFMSQARRPIREPRKRLGPSSIGSLPPHHSLPFEAHQKLTRPPRLGPVGAHEQDVLLPSTPQSELPGCDRHAHDAPCRARCGHGRGKELSWGADKQGDPWGLHLLLWVGTLVVMCLDCPECQPCRASCFLALQRMLPCTSGCPYDDTRLPQCLWSWQAHRRAAR